MKAVSAAEPSVCPQLMSRGTFRKRNHFVAANSRRPLVDPVERCEHRQIDHLLPLRLGSHATPSPGSERWDTAMPRSRPRAFPEPTMGTARWWRSRPCPRRSRPRRAAAEDETPVPDRERVAIHRAHRRAGLAIALGVVQPAVARASERLREHRSELDAVDVLARLLVDRAVRLHRAAEVDAAAVEDREARHARRRSSARCCGQRSCAD